MMDSLSTKKIIYRVILGIPKEMKNAVFVTFSVDTLMRNENKNFPAAQNKKRFKKF